MQNEKSSRYKNLDRVQIVGFIISFAIFVVLFVLAQDKIASFSLGLLVAILTQLFSMQMRQGDTEQRLLKADDLNHELYYDERLRTHIKGIVDDYIAIQKMGFELFRDHADKAIGDCHTVLHGMAYDGYVNAEYGGQFPSGGIFALKEATSSVKIVANEYAKYWRHGYPEPFIDLHRVALARHVEITRIFIQSRDVLCDLVEELERQSAMGIKVRVGFIEDGLPTKLILDGVIFDDRATTLLELATGGVPGLEKISIKPEVVQARIKDFKTLIDITKPLDAVIATLRELKLAAVHPQDLK